LPAGFDKVSAAMKISATQRKVSCYKAFSEVVSLGTDPKQEEATLAIETFARATPKL
jgi:hypothetical protein